MFRVDQAPPKRIQTMKIVVAEDHLMMREVLCQACANTFGHEVVAETADGMAALAAVTTSEPDLILLDLQLPGMNGFELITALRQLRRTPKILILSSCDDDFTIYRVERSGIDGFIDKNAGTVLILGLALEALAAGMRYFSEGFKARVRERRADPTAFDKFLTERECLILVLLSLTPADDKVADQLGISPEKVEKHRFNIFKKLRLRSMAELVRYGQRHGFNQLPNPRAAR